MQTLALAPATPCVIIAHGEETQRRALGEEIEKRHGLKPLLPDLRQMMEF